MTDVRTGASTVPELEEPRRVGAASSRRAVLITAGALGVSTVLTACGTDAEDTAAPEPPAGSAPVGASGGGSSVGAGSQPGGTNGVALASISEVPAGAGIIKGDHVITQPTEGTFRAFSKTCTHQGCPVSQISGGKINCKCHGSSFSIEDGSVQNGPATKPLPETKVKIDGGFIVAA